MDVQHLNICVKDISNILIVDKADGFLQKGHVEEAEVAVAVREGVVDLDSLIHQRYPQ